MIKPLAFLLLLDFSGSMDQVVDKQPKIQILKSQVRGILEASEPTAPAEVLIFGSNPKQGCRDLKRLPGASGPLAKELMRQPVGAFGKTPLSEGLRQLTRRAIETNSKTIITVTDGGDSCGQDPCQALAEMDSMLGKKNKSLNLILVAFDIKQDRAKFRCFKDAQFKQLNIKMVEAGNGAELMDQLKEAQIQALGLGDGGDQDKAAQVKKGTAKASANEKDAATAAAKDAATAAAGAGKGRKAPENISFLEVVGAPPEAEFELGGEKGRRWHGSFVLQTVPGEYALRFVDSFGISLKLTLAPEQYLKIPWGQLIGNRQTPVEIQGAAFELDWKPDEKTLKIHGDIKDLKTLAELSEKAVVNADLPFGSYEVTVLAPEWLKGKLRAHKIDVARGQKLSVDLKNLFGDEIQWVENPFPGRMSVLEVREKDGGSGSYLASPGQKFLPVLKTSTARFIDK